MNVNDLYVKERLIDIKTGETFGYIFEGESVDKEREEHYCVALSLKKLEELQYSDLSCLEYFDVVQSRAIFHKGCYVTEGFLENPDSPQQDLVDVPWEILDENRRAVWGYVFSKNRMIPLDDDIALRRALG